RGRARSLSDAVADGPGRALRRRSRQRCAAHLAPAMSELAAVLSAFREATHCEAAVWTQSSPDGAITAEAATSGARPPSALPTVGDGIAAVDTELGKMLVAAVAGPRRAWLGLGPCPAPAVDLRSYLRFLLPVVAQYLQSAL